MPVEMTTQHLIIQQLSNDLPLPAYKTVGAAGMDLYAAIEGDVRLQPGERCHFKTGIKVQLPPFYEMQIRPRSGMALHHGFTVLNTPGTIDEDYRGEIGVIGINLGQVYILIKRGDRIAQAVISPIARLPIIKGIVNETLRGENGFGSTGSGTG